MDAAEPGVEAAPARDAVDVGRDLRRRQRPQLLVVERDLLLHLAEDPQGPGRDVDVRDVAGVEHRPLLGQVLARAAGARGRSPPRAPCPRPSSGRAASAGTLDGMDVAAREREFVRVAGPDAADYLQRMVSNDVEALALGRGVPGAAPHREGARDRAARRAATRRRRLPAPDRAGPGRGRAHAAGADAPARAVRDRARGARVRARLRRRGGLRDGLARRARGARRRARADARRRRSSSCAGSRAACRAGSARSTTGSCRRRRASTRRTSPSRRAAIRGRSRLRGCTSAAIRTAGCASSSSQLRRAAGARRAAPPRRAGGRPRHERRAPRGRHRRRARVRADGGAG